MFSTTHTTELSLRGSEQIEQMSVSDILWQTLQYFMSWQTCVTASVNPSTSSTGWRSKCKTRRKAVLRPTPGNCEKPSTARSKSCDEYCCMRVLCCYRCALIIEEIDTNAHFEPYCRVIRAFKRLIVIDSWLDGYRSIEEEGIPHFHARHYVVISVISV